MKVIKYVALSCPECGGRKIRTTQSHISGIIRIRHHVCQSKDQSGRPCGNKFKSRERIGF